MNMNSISSLKNLNPVEEFGSELLSVEKPTRYIGGEFGAIAPWDGSPVFTIALCFPDLYEIGMSNNALRILYHELNLIPGVRCERVFAPAQDYAGLLVSKNRYLHTLESGIELNKVDLLGFTIGYELCATTLLSVLESGGLGILTKDRTEDDPIVIAGGPAVSNPHPFGAFLDAVWIGEAEAGFFDLVRRLSAMKSSGSTKSDLLKEIRSVSSVWSNATETGESGFHKGQHYLQTKVTKRAVFEDFSKKIYDTAFPVSAFKAVQSHGTVEIMRGCPNGCRFCHAGYFYRPQRIKDKSVIHAEVENLVRKGGYREITLASLSSGDFPGIGSLVKELNDKWAGEGISFQLPSLKVESFSLPLLESISEVRKSGLTFAVETPIERWQASINKSVSITRCMEILNEATRRGFKQAKFYFMIGLPVDGFGQGEAEAIVEFLSTIARSTRILISVTLGTFVPKPHTPYERCAQLSETESMHAISLIRGAMRQFRHIKISWHSPFSAQLEGIISRGDYRVSSLIYDAYKKGARFDAWDDKLEKHIWETAIACLGFDPVKEYLSERSENENLPWADVSIGVSPVTMKREKSRSDNEVFTKACNDPCDEPCGSCTGSLRVAPKSVEPLSGTCTEADSEGPVLPQDDKKNQQIKAPSTQLARDGFRRQIVLKYGKEGKGRWHSHLSVIDAFARAIIIARIPVLHTEGFNPIPKIETTPPLGLSAESASEVMQFFIHEESIAAWLELHGYSSPILLDDQFDSILANCMIKSIQAGLPKGINVIGLRSGAIFGRGDRSPGSIGSKFVGSSYTLSLSRFYLDRHDSGSEPYTILKSIAETGFADKVDWINISETSLDYLIRDAAGGKSNPSRILEAYTETRPVLADFKVVRTGTFALDSNGNLEDLFNAL